MVVQQHAAQFASNDMFLNGNSRRRGALHTIHHGGIAIATSMTARPLTSHIAAVVDGLRLARASTVRFDIASKALLSGWRLPR
jgi:hypothetical protein